MAFDPSDHLIKLKGNALYLPVTWRVVWLREEHPDAQITTEMVQLDLDAKLAIFRAEVKIPGGGSATGYGSETEQDFPGNYLEKAETKALGRALAALGLGTQFAMELEETDSGAQASRAPVRARPLATPRAASNGGQTGSSVPAGAPQMSAEEEQARAQVRSKLKVNFPELNLGLWRDLTSFAKETYGMEIPTAEQERDPSFRLSYLDVLASKLPGSAAEEAGPDALESYRERLAAAGSVAAISAVMHEAKEGGRLSSEALGELSRLATTRTAALRGAAASAAARAD